MQSIVMDTSPLQGWTTSNYKSFKAVDESSESGSDSDSESETDAPRKGNIRGYDNNRPYIASRLYSKRKSNW